MKANSFFVIVFLFGVISGAANGATDSSSDLQVSGFARLVAGAVDDKELEYFFYSDELSADSQSLFGLRADYSISENLEFVLQGVVYSGESRENQLTQVYLNYRPNRSTSIRIGRYISPLFNLSDSYDIGFSYPWITPPQQVYSEYLFINPEGIMLTHEFGNRDISGSFDVYWGQYSENFTVAGVSNEAESKAAKGLALNLTKGPWNTRLSFHDAHFDIDRKDIKLLQNTFSTIGFPTLSEAISLDGTIKFHQVAVNYDDLDYFIRTEWAKIKTDIFIMPEIESAYFTYGLNFYPFAIYSTLAWSDYSYPVLQNTIPLGLDPGLDQLHALIDDFDNLLPDDSLESLSLGARYDINNHLAIKAEVTYLNGKDGQRAFFNQVSQRNIEREAILYQLALEWVF